MPRVAPELRPVEESGGTSRKQESLYRTGCLMSRVAGCQNADVPRKQPEPSMLSVPEGVIPYGTVSYI